MTHRNGNEERETAGKPRLIVFAPIDYDEEIPACPDCAGDGCQVCMWTGLTEEDCDFAGLARARS